MRHEKLTALEESKKKRSDVLNFLGAFAVLRVRAGISRTARNPRDQLHTV